MWSYEYSQETKASSQTIWKLWTDVENWNQWDEDVRQSSLNGHFQINTTGTLHPNKGPRSTFTLTEVETERKFTNLSKLPLASMSFIHIMQPVASGIRITHRIEIIGLLAPLFGAILGRQLKAGLPTAVAGLIAMAERQNE
jgi:hypothetical protein